MIRPSKFILDFPIDTNTGVEDLLLLARYFEEVGAYAETELSAPALRLAALCNDRLSLIQSLLNNNSNSSNNKNSSSLSSYIARDLNRLDCDYLSSLQKDATFSES